MLVPPAMARAAAKAAVEAGTDPDEVTSSVGSFKCASDSSNFCRHHILHILK